MVLESTVICLDNSDWMRNGDYAPRRFDAQIDAAGILCNSRTNSNPENTVGILTMAGQGVEMLVSPTEEIGKILASFARVHVNGAHSDLSTAVQIAQLALKHRKNKNGGQRIIAFVGGPLLDTVESLQKIGKQLKKNNVAVDIILMGEIEENNEKLQEFVNATNSNDNSHLITVPPGVSPSNALFSSPVMSEHSSAGMMGGFGGGTVGGGGAGGSSGGGAGGDFDMYGGIDPSMDPELAMAIRISTEEARAQEESRVNALQKETAGSSSSSGGSGSSEPFGGFGATDEEDEEALIQRALEMSMADANTSSSSSGSSNGMPSAVPALPSTINAQGDGVVMHDEAIKGMEVEEEEDDEEAELRRALQLSVADSTGVVDSDFVDQLLQGTDLDDPLVQAALAQLNASNNKNNNNKGDGDNSKKRKGDEA